MQSNPNAPEMVDPTLPAGQEWVKQRLKEYRLCQNDDKAYGRYPDLIKAVKSIITDGRRDSEPSPEECRLYKVTLETYQDSNEDTFLNEVLPFMIRTRRWVPAALPFEPENLQQVSPKKSGEGQSTDKVSVDDSSIGQSTDDANQRMANLTKGEDRVSVAFLDNSLVRITNRDLSRNLPFFGETGKLHADLNKYMMKDAAMTNPRPDKTFALHQEKSKYQWPCDFTMPANIEAMLQIMRSCHHPFLVIEGKSCRGSIAEARNQACRDGAILVNADRQLRAHLNMPDVVGADLRTFVFSATLSPEVLEINVHWAEVPDNRQDPKSPDKPWRRPTYHMNNVFTKALADKDPGTLGKLRKPLHNILDWGVGKRFESLEPLYDAIVTYAEDHDPVTGAKNQGHKKQKTGW